MRKISEIDQTSKKLVLNMETIRVLTPDDLLGVNGGGAGAVSDVFINTACPACCPSNGKDPIFPSPNPNPNPITNPNPNPNPIINPITNPILI
jgi:hypothetical protein